MENLLKLKSELSFEKKKPKNERKNDLIASLHERIAAERKIVKSGFRNRQKENRKEEVNLKLSLWTKKAESYGKIREAKKKERLEAERAKAEKSNQKKKYK